MFSVVYVCESICPHCVTCHHYPWCITSHKYPDGIGNMGSSSEQVWTGVQSCPPYISTGLGGVPCHHCPWCIRPHCTEPHLGHVPLPTLGLDCTSRNFLVRMRVGHLNENWRWRVEVFCCTGLVNDSEILNRINGLNATKFLLDTAHQKEDLIHKFEVFAFFSYHRLSLNLITDVVLFRFCCQLCFVHECCVFKQVKWSAYWVHSFLQCALHFAHRGVLLHTFGECRYVGEFVTSSSRCAEKNAPNITWIILVDNYQLILHSYL